MEKVFPSMEVYVCMTSWHCEAFVFLSACTFALTIMPDLCYDRRVGPVRSDVVVYQGSSECTTWMV